MPWFPTLHDITSHGAAHLRPPTWESLDIVEVVNICRRNDLDPVEKLLAMGMDVPSSTYHPAGFGAFDRPGVSVTITPNEWIEDAVHVTETFVDEEGQVSISYIRPKGAKFSYEEILCADPGESKCP